MLLSFLSHLSGQAKYHESKLGDSEASEQAEGKLGERQEEKVFSPLSQHPLGITFTSPADCSFAYLLEYLERDCCWSIFDLVP